LSKEEGATKYQQAVISNETKDNLQANVNQRINDNLDLVKDPTKLSNVVNLVETANDFVTTHNKLVQEKFLATSAIIDTQFEIMNKSVKLATQDMQKSGSVMRTALEAASADIKVQLGEVSQTYADAANAALGAAMKLVGFAEGLDVPTGDDISTQNLVQKMYDMKDGDAYGYITSTRDKLNEWKKNGGKNKGTLKDILTEGWDDWGDAAKSVGLKLNDDVTEWSDADVNNLINVLNNEEFLNKIKSQQDTRNTETLQRNKSMMGAAAAASSTHLMPMYDGFTQGNGSSMLTSAAKVTPINDGSVQLAKSHPQDSALFAKAGGPFDTLFNKVFSKVDSIYSSLVGSPNNTTSQTPIQLNVSGELNLKSGNQTVDLLSMMKNNPSFLATMSQLIVTQLSKNVNGGKTGLFDWLRSI
jgi:hypothetical protein